MYACTVVYGRNPRNDVLADKEECMYVKALLWKRETKKKKEDNITRKVWK